MMEGKMHGKKLEEAKMHYEALMDSLEALGMSLEDLKEKMMGEESEEEEGSEYGEEEGEQEEGEKRPMDKNKIAIIIARMKNKMKGE